MGNKEEKLQPRMRFRGFTDAWEKRKLSDVYMKNTERNNGQFGVERTISIANMYFKQSGNGADDKSLGTYKVLRVGDIAFEGHRSKDFSYGRMVMNDIGDGIMSPRFTTLRPLHEQVISFWKVLIHYEPIMRYVLVRSTKKGTMMNELVVEDFMKNSIQVPAKEEQTKIGTFFATLDNLIAVNQRKLDLLKEQKKGYLQKMFPKNGAKVPELRFAGFADDWEQRKLSEIYDKIRNAFVGTATPYYVNQGHFYLESNNVKYGKLNFNNEVYINDDFYQKQKPNWLHTGDLVVVQSGHVGHSAVIPSELNNTAAHAVIIVAKPKQKIDPYFINDYLQTNIARKQIDNITTGNTIKHILASAMKMFEVSLPSYEEQRPISNLLAQIDDTIALHQRKLDLLKEQKKGFLQKMFV